MPLVRLVSQKKEASAAVAVSAGVTPHQLCCRSHTHIYSCALVDYVCYRRLTRLVGLIHQGRHQPEWELCPGIEDPHMLPSTSQQIMCVNATATTRYN